jgi:hypothetical protein
MRRAAMSSLARKRLPQLQTNLIAIGDSRRR